jgi:hypothetical protein
VIAGSLLLAIFLLYSAADGARLVTCAECGQPSAYPAHYPCRGGHCVATAAHHGFRTADWPYGLLVALMLLDAALWLATSLVR